jgi:phosphate transport system substrate-binding protein
MIKQFNKVFYIVLFISIVSCNKKEGSKEQKETILEGTTTVLVDETLTPIVEDQIQIFESKYNAKVNIDSKSEAEVVQSLTKNTSQVAILARTLTKNEISFFESKKLIPKITPFAKDAIALIANKNNKDTLIALNDVVDFLKNQNKSKVKGLVFDNPNSSTARYICELAGIKSLPENNVFSFKTNNEVIKYIAKNDGMIGIVGINYIYEPSVDMHQYIDKINVLNLKNTTDNQYYSPTQNNIAEGKYPLARDLYLINCQGFSGLGMGFASFIAGDIGQRIILKSGLVPVRFPTRKIIIRKEINNDKK